MPSSALLPSPLGTWPPAPRGPWRRAGLGWTHPSSSRLSSSVWGTLNPSSSSRPSGCSCLPRFLCPPPSSTPRALSCLPSMLKAMFSSRVYPSRSVGQLTYSYHVKPSSLPLPQVATPTSPHRLTHLQTHYSPKVSCSVSPNLIVSWFSILVACAAVSPGTISAGNLGVSEWLSSHPYGCIFMGYQVESSPSLVPLPPKGPLSR